MRGDYTQKTGRIWTMQMIMFSKKRSHEKLWKGSWGRRIAGRKKSLMDRKMEKKLNKKNNVKKLKQKVDRSAKFLIDDDHLWKYGIIFCEQISWITRSTNGSDLPSALGLVQIASVHVQKEWLNIFEEKRHGRSKANLVNPEKKAGGHMTDGDQAFPPTFRPVLYPLSIIMGMVSRCIETAIFSLWSV